MNRFALALVAAATAGAASLAPAVAADQAAKPALVTVVTAAEPQTQLMALTLTLQAKQQGSAVRVLLCGPGGDLALKQAPATATAALKPTGASPQGLLGKLVEAGAPVDVCAIYLPNRDLTAEALIEGVGQAKPDAMAAHLIADNTRILSF